MDEFVLRNESNFIKIYFETVHGFPNETGYWGGYDTESVIEIDVYGFKVKSLLYTSTGEISQLYKNLSICNDQLKGSLHFDNYEQNLNFDIIYNVNGHVLIKGSFYSQESFDTKLTFGFTTDQTFIQSTLRELRAIIDKYGDMKGVDDFRS